MPKLRVPVPSSLEHALDSALDKALSIQRPVVTGYLDRIRRGDPAATPGEVINKLDKAYRRSVIGIGAAAGGAAAVPGVGTVTSVAAGGAEIAAFVSATAMYVLALAEVHGISTSDPDLRRALVLGTMLGEGSVAAIEAGAASRDKHWAQIIARTTAKDKEKVKGINGKLGTMMLTRFGARQGALLAGRALPFGVGAGVGAVGNAALAKGTVKAAHRAFGPPPQKWGPRVIEG